MPNISLCGSVSKEKKVLSWKKSSTSKPFNSSSSMKSCWHFWHLKRDLYSMKIKEQTRKLAAGCTWVRQGEADVVWIWFSKSITWDWILIYSGWLIFFHPVLLTHLSNQLCDLFSQLYSQIRPRFWRFALQILLWDSLIILSLLFLSGVPLFLQGTLLILGHLIPFYRICQSLKRDFPKAYQEPISFWSILW